MIRKNLIDLGPYLASRGRAARLREEVVRAVETGGDSVVLDFADVKVVSDSFADELIAVLAAERGEEWFRRHIRVENTSPSIRSVLLQRLAHRLETDGRTHVEEGVTAGRTS